MEPRKLNLSRDDLWKWNNVIDKPGEVDARNKRDYEQNAVEQQIISETFIDKCRGTPLEDKARKMRINVLADHDPMKFRELGSDLRDKSYDAALMDTMQCSIGTATKDNFNPDKSIRIEMRDYIRSWLGTTKQMGAGVYGSVFVANFDRDFSVSDYPFLIKSNISDDNADNTSVHEAFILTQLNKLRNLTPNFEYLYGLAFVDKINVTYETLKLGSVGHGRAQLYTFLENAKGETLFNTILYDPSFHFDDLLSVLLQVFCSLDIANQAMQFCHYDLHSKNIMLRKLDKPRQFIYTLNFAGKKKVVHVVSNYLALIIDFGFSHIVYEGKHFGMDMGRGHEGTFAEESYPFADIWKLMGHLYAYSLSVEIKTGIVDKIFPYIMDGKPPTPAPKHSLTAAPDLTDVQYEWFVRVLLKVAGAAVIDQSESPYVDVPVYNCSDGSCSSIDKYLDKYDTTVASAASRTGGASAATGASKLGELTLEEALEVYRAGKYKGSKTVAMLNIDNLLKKRLNDFDLYPPDIASVDLMKEVKLVQLFNEYNKLEFLSHVVFGYTVDIEGLMPSKEAIKSYLRIFSDEGHLESIYKKYGDDGKKDSLVYKLRKERQKNKMHNNDIIDISRYVMSHVEYR